MEGVDIFMGIVAPYVNFFIFLFLAIRFFKKPIKGMLKKRQTDFQKLVAESSQAKEEALAKSKELDLRLQKLDSEIESIRSAAVGAAELEAKQLIEKTDHLVENMKKESQRLADMQVKQAKELISGEIIAQMAAQVTSKLETSLNDDAQKTLVSSKVASIRNLEREA